MFRDRVIRLREMIETIDEHDPLFNIYTFAHEDGRYCPGVVAACDPEFNRLGLTLDRGEPCHINTIPKVPVTYGMEALRTFFALAGNDVRRIFTPLYYGKIEVRPSDVTRMITRVLADAVADEGGDKRHTSQPRSGRS